MSKVIKQDSSDSDDGMFYSNNSDLSSIYSGTIEKDNENSESDLFSKVDDECDTTNLKQQESWLGKRLKSNLPHYDGKLKLSNNVESKIPQHSSSTDIFLLYYTLELISYIVDQSNLYRTQTNKIQQVPMTETDLNWISLLFIGGSSTK